MDAFFDLIAGTLAWFYGIWPSYGGAIILLTLTVMIVLTPLTLKGTRSMMRMQRLQPEMKRLQKEYKDDRQKLNEELMKFYKENQINPLGGCLPLLVQLPVFIVLFNVIRGLTNTGENGNFDPKYLDHNTELYQALSNTDTMNWLGIDLALTPMEALQDNFVTALPYLVMTAVILVTSYIQQKQVSGRNPSANANPQQQMLLKIMPLMLGVFSFTFQAALNLYFVTSNFWRMGQQWFIGRHIYGKDEDGKPIEATAREVDEDDDDRPKGFRGLLSSQIENARAARAEAEDKGFDRGSANGSSKAKAKPSGNGSKGKSGAGKGGTNKGGTDKSSGGKPKSKSGSRSTGGRATPKGSSGSLPQPRPRKKKKR
jgi:YidC/Oxa1 family membrane protein insertase